MGSANIGALIRDRRAKRIRCRIQTLALSRDQRVITTRVLARPARGAREKNWVTFSKCRRTHHARPAGPSASGY